MRLSLCALTLLAACSRTPIRTDAPAGPAAAGAATDTAAPAKPETEAATAKPETGVDWLVFSHLRGDTSGADSLLPFYSYRYDTAREERFLGVWPVLSGYQLGANGFYWFSLPLMTVFGDSGRTPSRQRFFTSLPLLTFINEEEQPEATRREFVSLPLLLLTREQVFRGSRGTVERDTWYTPVATSDRLVRRYDGAAGTDAATPPVEIVRRQLFAFSLGGEDKVSLVDLARWDDDAQLGMFNVFNFSLFGFARYRGRYAGARFLEQTEQDPMRQVERELAREVDARATSPIVTQMNVLGPLFNLRTDAARHTSWELASLFGYRREGEDARFSIIPLMLEFGADGPRFAPSTLTKLWPLLYHDEHARRWDILWPLAYYKDDEYEDRTELRIRVLFRYYQKADYTAVRVLDGVVYDHVRDSELASTNVLLGILYSEKSRHSDGFRSWEILRGLIFGRSEKTGEKPTYTVGFVRFGGGKLEPEATTAPPPEATPAR